MYAVKTDSVIKKGLFQAAVMLILLTSPELLMAETVDLTPISCCDGQLNSTTLNGENVWQNLTGHTYFYFDVPDSFSVTPGSPVYVKVTYYDERFGTVGLEYDSTKGTTIQDIYCRSETHTRSSRVNTRAFVVSYHELQFPKFDVRQNGNTDFRLYLADNEGVPLSVKNVSVQNTPFIDSQFQYVLTKPWLSSYIGPTKGYVDRSSLKHKVMVGYQGWFRTPNDLADRGWVHWCRNGVMEPTTVTVDQWPDVTGFGLKELFRAGQLKTRSGRPAYLFSSTIRETVQRHFQWMRNYNIDGAFLQRFVHPDTSGAWGHDEWVLHHVREAANLQGRIWAIEYDGLQGTNPDPFEIITTDWKWLVDVVGVVDDPSYAYEGTKPVVFIWGLCFPERNISKETANAIVDFFTDDPLYGGNYVIAGIPWWWRTMTEWYDHFQRYDGILAWMPQDHAEYVEDYRLLNSWGIDYYPHVWPGFSWANSFKLTGEIEYTPRNGGIFFWQKIYEAIGSGAERLFIGMFDEYDEGTAIMPMTDDPPNPPPDWGRFITNDSRPSDWWMMLAGEATEILLGYRPLNLLMPEEKDLANRSNTGSEAWVDLGTTDKNSLLHLTHPADGNTSAETFKGRNCRYNTTPGNDFYFYFDVDPNFAYQVSEGLDVTIEAEYYDRDGDIDLSLEYDGIAGPYVIHPKIITTHGTGEWRTVRFEIADAYFGNRQNNGSDLRLRLSHNIHIHIDRIWVTKDVHFSPAVSFPTSRDFGDVNLWAVSAPQEFTISNHGARELTIDTFSITGADISEFNIQNDHCSGQILGPLENCAVAVVFSPRSPGEKDASLVISPSDSDIHPLYVPLSGNAIGKAFQPDGDVAPLENRDGKVNVGDALITLRFALTLETPTQEDIAHGDVAPLDASGQPDPDGIITVGDALVILRKALGIIFF